MIKRPELLDRKFVAPGTIVVREGEDAISAYLIQSGEVLVFTTHNDKTIELGKLGPGDIFGEMALITDSKRRASVKTLTGGVLVTITRESFEKKLRRSDPTIRAIVKMFTARMVESNKSLAGQKSELAELAAVVTSVYQNVLEDMPRTRRRTFETTVGIQLENFLEAVRQFRDKFSG